MDFFEFYLLPFIGGIFLFLLIAVVVRIPGAALSKKFVALGTLAGLTKSEIIGKVGAPSAVSSQPEGKTLLQWRATGYHIALLFDANDVCEGITHNARA